MNENFLPLGQSTHVPRTDQTTSSLVETGIAMAQTHSPYQAARYMVMHKVGYNVVARVLADPASRRHCN